MLLLQATVQVPLDAYKLDFVFADVESGEGTYDNHGGFDYHLPVDGSGLTEPALHVVHVSLEMAPICKAHFRPKASQTENPAKNWSPPLPSVGGRSQVACSLTLLQSSEVV